MPHTHLRGKELYTTLIRNGQEIAYLANNKYYDFNYQYYNFLSKPISIQQVIIIYISPVIERFFRIFQSDCNFE